MGLQVGDEALQGRDHVVDRAGSASTSSIVGSFFMASAS
jgi:hypothetical protein